MASVALGSGAWRRIPGEAVAALLFVFSLSFPLLSQSTWNTVGPSGGDARAFAAVPSDSHHLYLGSTVGWLYESRDGGASWHHLAKLDASDDLVLDHIVVDPRSSSTLYVAAWKLESTGGGLWISHDGGHTFHEVEALHGQSIRAFAAAPSNPNILFAGSLDGVFRSTDAGVSWTLISPAGSKEIHEVESLAVDPSNPRIVYAGTWHLPWKTFDGGKHWTNIKDGVIDDSDVFSIIVDPAKPAIVYASACSGIYKSLNGGSLFKKIQGIPATARRTRVLKQNPSNREIVYAGTTEGLYRTVDGGRSFKRLTGPDVIVNDVFIDPSNAKHVLLATDRGGVQLSDDSAATFTVSNRGISGRKVESLLIDRTHPEMLYAGVVNDKSYGGVFVSDDSGAEWRHMQKGLEDRDVFALAQSPEGELLAGTSDGLFAFVSGEDASKKPAWQPRSIIQNNITKTATVITRKGQTANIEKTVADKPRTLTGRVSSLDLNGEVWLAAGADGLFTSRDKGATWQGGFVYGQGDYTGVAAHGKEQAAIRGRLLLLSSDAGQSWHARPVPDMLTVIHRVAFSADGTLWLGAREGIFLTRDLGKTWLWIERLPFRDITDLSYDAVTNRILATSRASDFIYSIDPVRLSWNWWRTGYKLNLVRMARGKVVAATLFDGVVVEPDSAAPSVGLP